MMRSTLCKAFVILLLCWTSNLKAGINYQTWFCGSGGSPSWPCPQSSNTILSSGTITGDLNYNWGGGVVLDSGLSQYVVVRLWGYFTMPGTVGTTYTVTFLNQDDDGSMTMVGPVGGSTTTVINDWSGQHPPANMQGSINLVGGTTYYYERLFSEWGGGAVMRQYWYIPGVHGGWTIMNGDTNFTTTAPAGAAGGGSYTSNITEGQQTNITANLNRTTALANGNEIYIDQVGNNNTTTITQTGNYNKITGTTQQTATITGDSNSTTIRQNSGSGKNLIDLNVTGTGSNTLNLNQGYLTDGTLSGNQLGGNYQKVDVQGNNNTVTTQQNRDVGTVGNYMEHSVIGNFNSITSTQSGDNKLLFNSISGNYNTVSTTQSGTGAQHYIDLTLTGAGNTATVNQSGNTQNKATIVINNLGGPAGINLTQTGGQTYNITTNCVTLGGCGTTTVNQAQ